MNSALALKPAWPWQSHPREATLALAGAALAAIALAGTVDAMPTLDRTAAVAEPIPATAPATALRDIAPDQAVALNARIPFAGGPLSAAPPFAMAGASADSRAQALECLTSAIYYEAGQQDNDGQRAVAQVILNRVRHPAFPNSVCGVVYQGSTRSTGCQFTFTCDGSLTRTPMSGAWDRARANARAMLGGAVFAPVGRATHYHANYVLPYWASSLVKTQVVGPHLFYRWAGNWGHPGAFAQAYGGREANARALRSAALAVPHVVPRAIAAGSAAAALDKVDGVKVEAVAGGRVAARFSPQARAAVEAVKLVPYVERVSASDNLRYALAGAEPSGEQPAFGAAKSDANSSSEAK